MHQAEVTAAGAIIYDFCLNDEEHCTARYQTLRHHAHSSISPTTNEHSVRRLGQTLQPHFSPSIPRVNSTCYLQDTNGASMAALRKIDLHTRPGALRRQQLWYLRVAKMAQRPPPCSHSITITCHRTLELPRVRLRFCRHWRKLRLRRLHMSTPPSPSHECPPKH
jgi:hypothetical protein